MSHSKVTLGLSNPKSPTNVGCFRCSLYGGFAFKGIRIGTELDFLDDKELTSAYLNYIINRKVSIFLRYDILNEDKVKDTYLISGLVYDCGSGILVSPNIRKSNKDDLVYKLNFQFRF